MNGLDFKLYQTINIDIERSYIQLQVGKRKKKETSVYIDTNAFDCIRGLIWNKYREFGRQQKTYQINNDDWHRILEGFKEATTELEVCTDVTQLVSMLSLPNHLLSQKETIFEHKQALHQFIESLIQWIETHLKKEKYILIIHHT